MKNNEQAKEYEHLNCKIEKSVAEKLTEVCQKTSLSKTVVTERAVRMYYEHYKKMDTIMLMKRC